MDIKTKYDFKDRVFKISKKQKCERVPCVFCGGEGRIKGMNEEYRSCPECYGNKGHNRHVGLGWEIDSLLTIGEIRVEYRCSNVSEDDSMFDNYGSQDEKYEEIYMCYETGIGSGTLHNGDNLFPTKQEALNECSKRNLLEAE